MNELQIFQFKQAPIRVTSLNDEPWFVAADVCQVLEIDNATQALTRIDDDERNTLILNEGIRGNPAVNCISESGLYALVLSSRKPQAKPFRRWVTHEVLPAIRKNGFYDHDSKAPALTFDGVKRMIFQVEKAFMDRRKNRIDLSTASVLASLACQYCRLWDVAIRLHGGPTNAVPKLKENGQR